MSTTEITNINTKINKMMYKYVNSRFLRHSVTDF